MKKPCTECHHFRAFRPLSQLLLCELAPSDSQIVSEVLKVMQDERQKKDEEALHKVEVYRRGDAAWPFRPAMSDYCGQSESQGRYLVHEIKNAEECGDHRPLERERPCRECRHCTPASGQATDAETLARLGGLQNLNAVVEGRSGDGGVQRFIELTGSMKSLEIAQAYYAGRFSVRRPEYLATCRKRSSAKNWAVCAVENLHDACTDWEPSDHAAIAPAEFMEVFNRTTR